MLSPKGQDRSAAGCEDRVDFLGAGFEISLAGIDCWLSLDVIINFNRPKAHVKTPPAARLAAGGSPFDQL